MTDQDQSPDAHAYDAPGLSPKQFLLHVMHDPDLPIGDRMAAASKLLRIVYIDGDYVLGAWCNKKAIAYHQHRWDRCPMIHSADMCHATGTTEITVKRENGGR